MPIVKGVRGTRRTGNFGLLVMIQRLHDVLLGISVDSKFSKQISVRPEYEDFGKLSNSTVGGDSHVGNLGLSVKYTY